MSNEEKFKKIAISQETFDKLTEEFINNLEQKENVVLVVMPREEIFSHAKKNSSDISGVILAQDEIKKYKKRLITEGILALLAQEEAKEYEKELTAQERIFEFKTPQHIEELLEDFPQMIDQGIYENQKRQNKYYVPRTIGRPNSKKKGGR